LSRLAAILTGPVQATLLSPKQGSVGAGHFRWF